MKRVTTGANMMSAAPNSPNRKSPAPPNRARLGPELHDAFDVLHRFRSGRLGRIDLAEVHAMLPPERQEAGVHFRGHGSGHAERRNFRGPDSLIGGLGMGRRAGGERGG